MAAPVELILLCSIMANGTYGNNNAYIFVAINNLEQEQRKSTYRTIRSV